MSILKNTELSKNSQHYLDLHKTLSLRFFRTSFYLANLNKLLPLLRQCANLIVYYSWQIFIIKVDDWYSLNLDVTLNLDITILMNCSVKALILKIVCHCVNNHSKHF